MKRNMLWLFCFIVLALTAGPLFAVEHGGKEHGGVSPATKEHGCEIAEPSKDDIHNAMLKHINEKSAKTGTFEIYDSETGKARGLELVRIHERVGKTGDYYYSCADFKDLNSGEMLDLDLDVAHREGKLEVVDVRIHKVDGKARYTYDEHDKRIPVEKR